MKKYFQTEGCCDYFDFYAGPTTNYPTFGRWGGEASNLEFAWSEPVLLITWKSDGSVQKSSALWGWVGVV